MSANANIQCSWRTQRLGRVEPCNPHVDSSTKRRQRHNATWPHRAGPVLNCACVRRHYDGTQSRSCHLTDSHFAKDNCRCPAGTDGLARTALYSNGATLFWHGYAQRVRTYSPTVPLVARACLHQRARAVHRDGLVQPAGVLGFGRGGSGARQSLRSCAILEESALARWLRRSRRFRQH